MTRKTRLIASVAAALLLLTGLTLITICWVTDMWDGKWVLGFVLILGFVGVTAWTDRPKATR